MAQFLCVRWGKAYGISVDMGEELHRGIRYVDDWDEYLADKTRANLGHEKDGWCTQAWEALFRLEAMGLLHDLPFPPE